MSNLTQSSTSTSCTHSPPRLKDPLDQNYSKTSFTSSLPSSSSKMKRNKNLAPGSNEICLTSKQAQQNRVNNKKIWTSKKKQPKKLLGFMPLKETNYCLLQSIQTNHSRSCHMSLNNFDSGYTRNAQMRFMDHSLVITIESQPPFVLHSF